MTRWHVIPVLGSLLIGGAAQAYVASDAGDKAPVAQVAPGVMAQAPTYPAPGYRPPTQGYGAPAYPSAAPTYSAPPVFRPSPSDPYAGVTLPTQRGDAAYQGGGVVLEQDGNGVNRRVR